MIRSRTSCDLANGHQAGLPNGQPSRAQCWCKTVLSLSHRIYLNTADVLDGFENGVRLPLAGVLSHVSLHLLFLLLSMLS